MSTTLSEVTNMLPLYKITPVHEAKAHQAQEALKSGAAPGNDSQFVNDFMFLRSRILQVNFSQPLSDVDQHFISASLKTIKNARVNFRSNDYRLDQYSACCQGL